MAQRVSARKPKDFTLGPLRLSMQSSAGVKFVHVHWVGHGCVFTVERKQLRRAHAWLGRALAWVLED